MASCGNEQLLTIGSAYASLTPFSREVVATQLLCLIAGTTSCTVPSLLAGQACWECLGLHTRAAITAMLLRDIVAAGGVTISNDPVVLAANAGCLMGQDGNSQNLIWLANLATVAGSPSLNSLMADSECLHCYTSAQLGVANLVLLQSIAGNTSSPQALATAASCYHCLTLGQLLALQVSLVGLVEEVEAVSYLIQQGFEGAPFDHGEVWTSGGTTPLNPNYVTTPLAGTKSLNILLPSTDGILTSPTFADQAECWFYFLFRLNALNGVGSSVFVTLLNGVATECVRLQSLVTGAFSVRAGGGVAGTTTALAATNTTYHVWVHYIKGTGVNAFASVAFSTTGIRPNAGTSFASSSVGTSVSNANNLRLGTTVLAIQDTIIDQVRVSSSEIGDNPP